MLFLILFLLLSCMAVMAGNLKGTIIDKSTREPLTGATVQVVGTTLGAVADMDGNYRLNLKPGTYTLQVSYIGYKTETVENLTIGGADREMNFELVTDTEVLGEVTVTARKNLESERALQMERQKATLAIENMGAKEMSLKGISNVQEGVKKITGISIASAGQLIVRGLGDRYSTTTLNGLPIASPNPDNKLIPLDIFPAATVQNITVSKVYEAGAFADYSGAHVDISTKGNTGQDYFSINFNMGSQFNVLGKDIYQSDLKGSMFRTNNLDNKYWNMSLTDFENTVNKEDIFGTSFAIHRKTALPDFSGSVGGAKTWRFDNGNAFNLLASASISNKTEILKDAFVTTLNAQGRENNHFDYDSYSQELRLAGLLNLGYSFRQNDRINYTFFYARNAINDYMSRSGFDYETNNLWGSNSVFHAYSLMNNQLSGHHEVGDKWKIDWSGSYGITASDEPDRRQVMFRRDPETDLPVSLFLENQQEIARYFGELDEREGVGDIRATYNFDEENLIRFGGTYKNKQREFRSANFYYNLDNVDADITTIYDTDSYLNFENVANGSIIITRNMQARNSYQAAHDIWAAFVEAEYHPTDRLLISLGLRYEQSRQTVDYHGDDSQAHRSTLEKGDFFPALNIKYTLNDEQSLRFSASRTVTRPAFVEMAPFLYRESYGSSSLRGNQDIENGYNINFDLRYELFPQNSTDMFSITGYFKALQSPIERVQRSEGGATVHSFRNAGDGIAAGVEIEGRKEIFKDFRVGANASFMYTNVNLPEGEGIYTESQRALQGASPYLVNADVSYAPRFGEESQLILALVYNLQGPRIHTVGIYGLGDVKQDPLHTLDFVATYQINKHFSVKAEVKDLLNSTIRFKQDVPNVGEKITVESFQPGTGAEIGFSYRF